MRHRITPEIVDVAALDGFGLNLHHYPGAGGGQPDPVIVVRGAALRSNLFLPPAEQTFVDALLDAGSVWCPHQEVRPTLARLGTNHNGSMR